jgi:hypothetical protein
VLVVIFIYVDDYAMPLSQKHHILKKKVPETGTWANRRGKWYMVFDYSESCRFRQMPERG